MSLYLPPQHHYLIYENGGWLWLHYILPSSLKRGQPIKSAHVDLNLNISFWCGCSLRDISEFSWTELPAIGPLSTRGMEPCMRASFIKVLPLFITETSDPDNHGGLYAILLHVEFQWVMASRFILLISRKNRSSEIIKGCFLLCWMAIPSFPPEMISISFYSSATFEFLPWWEWKKKRKKPRSQLDGLPGLASSIVRQQEQCRKGHVSKD